MEILSTLGINSTVFVQLAIFCVVYIFLSNFVFKPYFVALKERNQRTVGNQELAEKLLEETKTLQTEYEIKAREQSANYKNIFDQSRKDANKKHEEIVNAAREQAKELLNEAKAEISNEIKAAQSDLAKEVPQVAQVVESQLLGKIADGARP